ALGAFVTTLDNTIVAAGAPSIARALGLDLGALQWIALGYMLPFAGLLPAAGTLIDRWGRRPALTAALLLFGFGAAAGGLAGSVWPLVAARVLQGVAAAFLLPGLLSLLRTNLDMRGRTLRAAAWQACLAAARGLCPRRAGLPLALGAVAVVVPPPSASAAGGRAGPHRTVAAGLAVVGTGLLALAAVNHVPALLLRLPGMVLIGVGSAFAVPMT